MYFERNPIELESGRVLVMLSNEGHLYGLFEVLADGRARQWEEVWHERYRPTDVVYPGPISFMRAVKEGAI